MQIRHASTVLLAGAALVLAGCGEGSSGTAQSAASSASAAVSSEAAAASSSAHDMAGHGSASATSADPHAGHAMDGGPAPAGIKESAAATFAKGAKVVLSADHMPGMSGSTATVVGAYDTVTYAVDYTPTTGGAEVKDHKWVVQEELKDAGTSKLADGTKVTIEADHMPGMKGAEGTIASSTTEPVYMVDVDMPGMPMKNHKWVVESEMKPAS